MENEIWKDVPNYEGLYQISDLSRVKSLPRKMVKGKAVFISTEKILKPAQNSGGYMQVILCKSGTQKAITIHQLIAMTFLGHTPCGYELVIDHINDNKLDNRVENLQIVTNRFNACKTQGKYSSQYKGVSWSKRYKKWQSLIQINGINTHLGLFNCELAASLAYQNKLKQIL